MTGTEFLQWALPRMGYKWSGFRKPRGQVLKRIRRRMQHLELSGGYKAYQSYLQKNPDEWNRLDQLCDVTISKFFRDRKVWDYLYDEILPLLLISGPKRTVNIWSAGCCNGEEPYSVAILLEQLKENIAIERKINILASDRNEQVLERAKAGRYPAGALKELTDLERNLFFRQAGEETDVYLIREEVKRLVEFEWRDISRTLPERRFDLIFCRNLVFTYFGRKEQLDFLQKLKSRLITDGYLVAGSHEQLPETSWLERVNKMCPLWQKR